MATVGSLDIQISASMEKANASLDLLVKRLDRVSASLSSANTRGLATMGAGVNKLANAINNFSNNTKSADFSRLSRNLESISKIDTSKFTDISSKITRLSTAFRGVGTIDTSGVTNIATSLSRLGGKNAIAGADNLIKVGDKLGQFVTQMNGIESLTFDATSLSNLISSISRLGGKTATEAAKNLPPISAQLQNFVRQLNNIGSLNFDTTNLSNLISGISRLGGKAAASAATNIPKLATELNSLMATLSRAPTINRNVIDMTNALANLARTGASSGRAANSLSQSFTSVSVTGNKALGTLKGMQGTFRNLLRSILPFVGAFQLISFGKQAMEISSSLTEVQNVVDVTFGDFKDKIEDFAKISIPQFGMSELTAKEISSRFQAMGTAMGFARGEMSDMSVNLTKLTADMASFYNVEQDIVAEKLASIFTGQTRPLRDFGLDLTQATLQEWALKQGMDANIQSMSQAEKTMLRYQYVLANTTAAQGDFARTALTWANQVRILKQNFEQLASVIGGVLVNAFKPVVIAINKAMSAIIAFAKTISDALGKIFGWTYEEGGGGIAGDFEDAETAAGGIEDATGGAAKNIKKMQAGLRAFDELNLINLGDNDGGSGSGTGAGGAGGGAGADGYGGNWIKTDSILKGYESELDTLYKLGDYIGTKLSEAMESIDWQGIYEGARNFGTGLASFLNGLISPRLFGNVGTTIAGALNTALHFLDSFGEEFDWHNFGESIAAGVNNFFSTFDFALLADTINTWANGLLDATIEFLDDTEWEMIGEQIGTFLEGLDFIEIGGKLAEALGKAIDSAIETWKGMFKAAPIETAIITAIAALKFTGLGTEWFSTLSSKMSATIKGKSIGLKPTIAIAAVTWEIGFDIGKSLGQFLSEKEIISEADYENFKWFGEGGFFDQIIPDTSNFESFIEDVKLLFKSFEGMATDFKNNPVVASLVTLLNPFASAKKRAEIDATILVKTIENFGNTNKFFIDNFKNTNEEIGNQIDFLADNFKDTNKFLADNFKDTNEEIGRQLGFLKDNFDNTNKEIESQFNTLGESVKSWWDTDIVGAFSLWAQDISDFWNENVAPWFTFEKWSELGQAILDGISAKWNELSAWWGDTAIVSWWEEDVAPWFTVEKWHELGENIKSGISEKWNEFSEWWQNTGIYNWWNENVTPWFDKDKWSFSGIKEGLSESWNAAIDSIKQIWNKFASWLNDKLTWTIDPISIAGKTVFEGATIDLGKIPMFAKGGVFRGGNPFMAIVNDQPRGQTNIEAPLKVIRQALREELEFLNSKARMTMPTDVFANLGQFEPTPPPEFDLEARRQGVYEIAAEIQRENSGTFSDSDGYNNYSEELSLLMSQNQLLREQNRLLQAILDKPTLDSDSLYTNFVQKSMEMGGNFHGGKMNRLAVAQELYR